MKILDNDILWRVSQEKTKKLVRSFDFTLRYVDDVHLLNLCGGCVARIYGIIFEGMNTTDMTRSATYLGIHLNSEGWLRTIFPF